MIIDPTVPSKLILETSSRPMIITTVGNINIWIIVFLWLRLSIYVDCVLTL